MFKSKKFVFGASALGVLVLGATIFVAACFAYPVLKQEAAKVAPTVALYPGYPVSRHGIPTAVYGADSCPSSGSALPGASDGAETGCILLRPGKVHVRYFDRDHVVDEFWSVKSSEGQTTAYWSDGSPVMPWEYKAGS